MPFATQKKSYPGGSRVRQLTRHSLGAALVLTLAACSGGGSFGSNPFGSLSSGNIFGGSSGSAARAEANTPTQQATRTRGGSVVAVNRYLWAASLDVLSFLPIDSVDPFTGVITTGYGTPPGGGRAYRAVVHVSDPALDARSLKVALFTRSGAVNAATNRAVEDAILGRARQLRIGTR